MESAGTVEADVVPPLPPPPTSIPPNVNPDVSNTPKHSIICRRGFGSSGRPISLLSNHFKVSINFPDKIVYQYNVLFTSEDKRAVEGKCLGRKLIDKLYQTYSSELGRKRFPYDDKSLYSVGPLPQNNFEFTMVLEETFARRDGIPESGEGPIDSGAEADSTLDGLRMLDIILRQQAANRKLLQDFFHTSNSRKPEQIILFRDGVSESQFNQVLNIELEQIIKAYEDLGADNIPKFTVIVAQKNHHTKLFRADASGDSRAGPGSVNVPPGYAHLSVLTLSLSLSQGHLWIERLSILEIMISTCVHMMGKLQFVKFEESSETLSQRDVTSVGSVPVPELPKLHKKVQGSMFFC